MRQYSLFKFHTGRIFFFKFIPQNLCCMALKYAIKNKHICYKHICYKSDIQQFTT